MAFSASEPADSPGPTQWANGCLKSANIDVDSYSACYDRPTKPTKKIGRKMAFSASEPANLPGPTRNHSTKKQTKKTNVHGKIFGLKISKNGFFTHCAKQFLKN